MFEQIIFGEAAMISNDTWIDNEEKHLGRIKKEKRRRW